MSVSRSYVPELFPTEFVSVIRSTLSRVTTAQVRRAKPDSGFPAFSGPVLTHAHDINAMFAPERGRHSRLRVPDDPTILLEYDILATFSEADHAEDGA